MTEMEKFDFICDYCGKNYRKDPLKLSLHIRNNHIDQ